MTIRKEYRVFRGRNPKYSTEVINTLARIVKIYNKAIKQGITKDWWDYGPIQNCLLCNVLTDNKVSRFPTCEHCPLNYCISHTYGRLVDYIQQSKYIKTNKLIFRKLLKRRLEFLVKTARKNGVIINKVAIKKEDNNEHPQKIKRKRLNNKRTQDRNNSSKAIYMLYD